MGGKVELAKRGFVRIAGIVALAALAQSAVMTSALAQSSSENNCVCVVDAGTTGLVTSASGWVKLNGDAGLIDAKEDAPLSLGSVLETGVAGSASATVGTSCEVDVAALTEMTITKLESGKMCVRLSQKKPLIVPGKSSTGTAIAVGAGSALAGTAIVVGLGQKAPVSQ